VKTIKIALVGQPNVGKSMLTNSIGGATLHVGNFTGVTVEKKEIKFQYKDFDISMVDLPGTYMLADYSMEEKVTSNFLKYEDYDLILNVVDSTNLERNLQLTSELLNLDRKMVIALNMSDEAKKEGIEINSNYMSELLGVDCIKVSAKTKEGIEHLLATIVRTYSYEKKESKLVFGEPIEEEILSITEHLNECKFKNELSYRKIAIGLISEDKDIYKIMHDEPIWTTLQPIVSNAISHIRKHHDNDALIDIFAEEFMAFNQGVITETVKEKKIDENRITLTKKIDNVLIHPILGIPIFLFFMWGLFQLTFEVGAIPMDYIDAFFGSLGDSVGGFIENDDFRSLVVDGLIAGVGAVVLFVPNIMILFIGIALLESTGYMSRVAYLLDGLFIIGFMSCGARLPVYVLFIGAFFSPENAGNILFAIYIGGAILGLIFAKILKMTAFRGDSEPFVMEMPKYRMPSFVLIWHTVKTKTMMYLKKAGTFIALASMLVWFASNYPHNHDLSQSYEIKIEQASEDKKTDLENELNEKLLEQSYLGQIGHFIEPVFAPLGMDWKMGVALQTGLAAKEVVVSTLGVLYSLGGDVDEENNSLIQRLHDNISFASAVAFIIIMMTYLPCLAATIVFAREAGGAKYAVYLFVFTSMVAYLLAFIGYNLAL